MRVWVAVLILASACHSADPFPISTPGGGGDAGVDATPCTLVSCASANAACGPIGDGCGGTIECGSCTAPDFCGGAGTYFQCGDSSVCVPKTCGTANCGVIADGCGGVTASCGTCAANELCGANGLANTCGVPTCTGLCLQQNACTNQPHTTISGIVTSPGHTDTATWGTPDPIYGALVYVPNSTVNPFPPGVACESCSSLVSGSPLVSATTAVDGTFAIDNAPCGTSIPLVIQLGRWRREITIPSVACCANTALTNAQTHLPRSRIGEPGDVRSDIPLMAVSTGDVDTLHCVLRKAGVADSEFTDPNGAGRVQFYQDNGAVIDSSTPAVSSLVDTAATLSRYDLVLFECVGEQVAKTAAEQQRVIDFANAGGRVFATHYSYTWLTDSNGTAGTNTGPKPLSQTATWLVNQGQYDTASAVVDQTLQGDPATQTRRIAFASWLKLVGASITLGQIALEVVRHDLDAVSSIPATAAGTPAQRWLTASTPFTAPVHYTFDTPIAYPPLSQPTKQCGRVLFSDFHVSDSTSANMTFPTECANAPLTAQEKTLEFMVFDLSSCIGPQPSACTPKTCEQLGIGCGLSGDGCDDGFILSCGGCSNGQVCGQGEGDSQCGYGSCVPRTCADAMATCGAIGNGCGGVAECGTCSDGSVCGGDGVPNQCGTVLK